VNSSTSFLISSIAYSVAKSTEMKALSPESIGVSPVILYHQLDDVYNQAVSEGDTVLNSIRDQFYGDRSGYLRDPFGHLVFYS
jgi:uncharacterized glyoxalase superfamily protein PhnB